MNETEHNKSGVWSIVGLIALILALFVGIKLIFAWMSVLVPPQTQDGAQTSAQSQVVEEEPGVKAPAFCPFCGEELHDSFQWGQFCPFCGEKVER